MDKYLLVSGSDKGREYLYDVVSTGDSVHIDTLKTAGQARRQMLEQDEYDVIIINTPLSDESGIDLAIDLATQYNSSVIVIVKSDSYEQVQAYVEDAGVYVVCKPISRQIFYSSMKYAMVARKKTLSLIEKQKTLKKQMEDMKIIDRAKCCLIEYLKMSENAAHRHIEKQAMDLRRTKRMIAEDILKTYEM